MTVFFVYGTLKKEECRGHIFSEYLNENEFKIIPTSIKADLYDLGPYPAIIPGEGTVHGEAVIVKNQDKADKLIKRLDQIEGYYGEKSMSNLFLRKNTVAKVDEDQVEVITYMFNHEQQLRDRAKHLPEGIWSSRKCTQEKKGMEDGK